MFSEWGVRRGEDGEVEGGTAPPHVVSFVSSLGSFGYVAASLRALRYVARLRYT